LAVWNLDLLSETELLKVVCSAWTDFLGVTAVPSAVNKPPSGELVTGVVRFQGDWNGGLALTMNQQHARNLAAAVFVLEVAKVTDEDYTDLISDLANILAGNVKALAVGSCTLNLPQVHMGEFTDNQLVEDGQILLRTVLRSHDESVLIRVF
jgi:chemotaxis protein CheX